MRPHATEGEFSGAFRMTMFRMGFVLAVLLLWGCAGLSAAPGSIKRVAVISMIGDKFTTQKISLNLFEAKQNTIPIGAWGIDQFVVNKVRKVLAGRFDVRPLAYHPVADANDVAVKIVEGVRAQSAPTDIDAYIVVTKSMVQDNSRQKYYGLGIVDHATFGHRVELDVSWMPATLEAAQNIRLKTVVTELLDRTLPGTIESLKLPQ